MIALPPERPGTPAAADLAGRRQQMTDAAAAGLWRTEPPPQTVTLAGRRALRFDPPGAIRGILLHMHGGAFRIGMPEAVAPFAAAIARRCGVAVICPAYRLAPEYPFPAALNDGMAVLGALDVGAGCPLILSGDSAGGGLACGMAALTGALGRPAAGLMLLSAWLDLTVSSTSYERNGGTDPVFSRAAASEAASLYLQGVAPDHPLASPLFAQAAGLPPTLISVGAGEVLLDDSTALHRRLAEAGAQARLCVVPGMEHVAVTRGLALPGAAETLSSIVNFIGDVLAPA